MVSFSVYILIWLSFPFKLCVYGSITAFTNLGPVEGVEFLTDSGRVVNAFFGVPFAKPPIGKHRFEKPIPIEKWSGAWMAKKPSSPCIQIKYLGNSVVGSEDCLYLNIFTPNLLNNSSLPVIIYIHGGSFLIGEGFRYTPEHLLDSGDFIMVTINYRLGPFGFLSTEDSVIPGNNGLKDQVLAFKWVKDNIAAFGGDRGKVTIAGNSAGGASVHFHYFSPLSKGLFVKGISASGCALNPWVLTEEPLQKAKLLAASVGCPTKNTVIMVECLKQRPGQQIFLFFKPLFMPWIESPFTAFGPVIEISGTDPFLNEHPYQMLLKGSVLDTPWLASVTKEEGLYPGGLFIFREDKMKELAEDWHNIAPHLMDFNFTVSSDKQNSVSDKIRSFYFGEENQFSESSQVKLIEMLGDRHFKADIGNAVRMHASITKSSVFFFTYNYRTLSVSNFFSKNETSFGVSHGDDILLIFGKYNMMTESDKIMALMMRKIWLNFMNFGDPRPSNDIEWSPVSPVSSANDSSLKYFYITSPTDMGMQEAVDFGNLKFWNSLELAENSKYNSFLQHLNKGSTLQIRLLLGLPIMFMFWNSSYWV